MKKFTKNNENFICINCSKEVEKHPTSSRDHCNYCLYSLHVDIFPGDRANTCRGVLRPIDIKTSNGKTQIVYVCEKCGEIENNIVASDDNEEEILMLTNKIV
jgi:DNA-directed RNA polymerase subunit RPC12/RpoP